MYRLYAQDPRPSVPMREVLGDLADVAEFTDRHLDDACAFFGIPREIERITVDNFWNHYKPVNDTLSMFIIPLSPVPSHGCTFTLMKM